MKHLQNSNPLAILAPSGSLASKFDFLLSFYIYYIKSRARIKYESVVYKLKLAIFEYFTII